MIALFIVIVVEVLVPLYEPEPVPLQPIQSYFSPDTVGGAVDEIVIVEPAAYHSPLLGLTVPKFLETVNRY